MFRPKTEEDMLEEILVGQMRKTKIRKTGGFKRQYTVLTIGAVILLFIF